MRMVRTEADFAELSSYGWSGCMHDSDCACNHATLKKDKEASILFQNHGVKPAPVEQPWERCSRCGIHIDDEIHNMLTDVRVIIAAGEEGYADITQYLCNDHLAEMQDSLMTLGFKDHRHGGINYLEDTECPDGYGKCTRQGEDKNGDSPPWSGTYIPIPPKAS